MGEGPCVQAWGHARGIQVMPCFTDSFPSPTTAYSLSPVSALSSPAAGREGEQSHVPARHRERP